MFFFSVEASLPHLVERKAQARETHILAKQLRPFQNMPGKKAPPKGNESHPDAYNARYDDFPEVRALQPPLLSEWRAQRKALGGQTALWMINISLKEKGETHKPTLIGGFNPFKKYCSNWIISPGRGENNKKSLNP